MTTEHSSCSTSPPPAGPGPASTPGPDRDHDPPHHEQPLAGAGNNTAAAMGMLGDGAADIAAPGRCPPESVARMGKEERCLAERNLRRKVDLRLMPVVLIMYILNYIDRTNIAAAKLAGLTEDLRIDPNSHQFQTAVSILFVGYLVMQVPSNLALARMGKPALYLSSCMAVWGVISAATAACQNYTGLLIIRFLLGFVEAVYFPGTLYFLSSWYTPRELSLRIAVLSSGPLISGTISGLISAAVTSGMDGVSGLRAWRWLFLIEGSVTVLVAGAAAWVLPDMPSTTSWLTPEERDLAVWRIEEALGPQEKMAVVNKGWANLWGGLKMALADVKTWLLALLLVSTVSGCAVTNFLPSVVRTLGYSDTHTLLLTSPPYLIAVVTTLINASWSDRSGRRYRHVVAPMVIAVGAFAVAAAVTSPPLRYACMLLMIPGLFTSYVVSLAWLSNSLPAPSEKRAAGIGLANMVSNVAQIWASYMYPDSAAPRYVIAMAVNAATSALAIVAATALRWALVRSNRELDRAEGVPGVGSEGGEGGGVDGVSEGGGGRQQAMKAKGFRYRV